MSTHIHGSFLSGTVRHISYRGLLSAQLTDEAFIVSILGGTLVTIPLRTIQEVRLGQMPSDFGIKVYYTFAMRSPTAQNAPRHSNLIAVFIDAAQKQFQDQQIQEYLVSIRRYLH